jgi:hypothetical protein
LADQPDPPQGTIGPTRARYLAAAFALGGGLGYLLVPLTERLNGSAPTVAWRSVGVLAVIAAVLLAQAYTTHRTVHRERARLAAHRAVNLLMLAKASALTGALVAGGYTGFAVQFLDRLDVDLPRERVIASFGAAAASVAIVIAALLLERACRVPRDPED